MRNFRETVSRQMNGQLNGKVNSVLLTAKQYTLEGGKKPTHTLYSSKSIQESNLVSLQTAAWRSLLSLQMQSKKANKMFGYIRNGMENNKKLMHFYKSMTWPHLGTVCSTLQNRGGSGKEDKNDQVMKKTSPMMWLKRLGLLPQKGDKWRHD